MARRRRRGQEFWSRLVAEFQGQELSQVEFARRKRVKLATLRYWLAKLRETSQPEPVRFVEVVAAEETAAGDAVRIRLPGGVELQLSSLPSPEYLASLDVALLRSRS
jgi:hypothetical protein